MTAGTGALKSQLTADSLYCYRVRSTNANGSTVSVPQCVYTRVHHRRHGKPDRAVRLTGTDSPREANIPNAGTDDTTMLPASNIFTVDFSQLRAAPGWYTFNPPPLPVIHIGEVKSVLESRFGDSFHSSGAYWGSAGRGNVTPKPGQNAFHVDTYFKANVNDAPDPRRPRVVRPRGERRLPAGRHGHPVHRPRERRRRRESRRGRCDRRRLRVRRHGSAGATCIQSGVEHMVRAAFNGLTKTSSTTPGVQQCQNDLQRLIRPHGASPRHAWG
jgi:hypothetical protein